MNRLVVASTLIITLVALSGSAMGASGTLTMDEPTAQTYTDPNTNGIPYDVTVTNNGTADPYAITLNITDGSNTVMVLAKGAKFSNGETVEYAGNYTNFTSLETGKNWTADAKFITFDGTTILDEKTVIFQTKQSDTSPPIIGNIRAEESYENNDTTDNVIHSGDKIHFKGNVTDIDSYIDGSSGRLILNGAEVGKAYYDGYNDNFNMEATYTVQNASTFSLDSFGFKISDRSGNTANKTVTSSDLIFKGESTSDNTTDNSTDDNMTDDNGTDDSDIKEYNITKLRDVPGDQSFKYLSNSSATSNMTYRNSTAKANGSAIYQTQDVKSKSFDRVEVNMSGAEGTLEIVNASKNGTVLKSANLSTGLNNISMSALNATDVYLKFSLNDGATFNSVKLYGEVADNGLFGGGNLITGNFFGNIPVIGDLLAGIAHAVGNITSAVLGIPGAIWEGLLTLTPTV